MIVEAFDLYFTFTLLLCNNESVKVNDGMTKYELLDELVRKGNGYLCTSDVLKHGVSKPTLAEFVRRRKMERAAQGIYYSGEYWQDDLFLLRLSNRRIVFSHETALAIHGLTEREPFHVSVTVKKGYNATHLRKQGVHVYQAKEEYADIGITEGKTFFGNTVPVYDRERTICDILRYKDSMDVQVFLYAVKEYMASNEKDLIKLMKYAELFKIEPLVRMYTEVLL